MGMMLFLRSLIGRNTLEFCLRLRLSWGNVGGRISFLGIGMVYWCRIERDRCVDCHWGWFSFAWDVILSVVVCCNIWYLFLCCWVRLAWLSTSWILVCFFCSTIWERRDIINFIFLRWRERCREGIGLRFLWNLCKLALFCIVLSCCRLLCWIQDGWWFWHSLFFYFLFLLWICGACHHMLFSIHHLEIEYMISIFDIFMGLGYTYFCLRLREEARISSFSVETVQKW